jgi:hypothetical protein
MAVTIIMFTMNVFLPDTTSNKEFLDLKSLGANSRKKNKGIVRPFQGYASIQGIDKLSRSLEKQRSHECH